MGSSGLYPTRLVVCTCFSETSESPKALSTHQHFSTGWTMMDPPPQQTHITTTVQPPHRLQRQFFFSCQKFVSTSIFATSTCTLFATKPIHHAYAAMASAISIATPLVCWNIVLPLWFKHMVPIHFSMATPAK